MLIWSGVGESKYLPGMPSSGTDKQLFASGQWDGGPQSNSEARGICNLPSSFLSFQVHPEHGRSGEDSGSRASGKFNTDLRMLTQGTTCLSCVNFQVSLAFFFFGLWFLNLFLWRPAKGYQLAQNLPQHLGFLVFVFVCRVHQG